MDVVFKCYSKYAIKISICSNVLLTVHMSNSDKVIAK